jgi:hypothetical protein
MSRYYPRGIPKSNERPILLGVRLLYYSQSTVCYLSMDVQWGTTIRLHYRQERTSSVSAYVRTKRQELCPLTLAYVWSRSLIPQNAFLVDPSDPKSKLTL